MQLLPLTSAEVDFLTVLAPEVDPLQARLTRKLAATLTARLRLPIGMTPIRLIQQDSAAVGAPLWQPDERLANLWLTRRLGGQRVYGTATFVPASLFRMLDEALAECWLDQPVQGMSAPLAWHIDSSLAQATLALQLPSHPTDMTRWARGVIRHV
jgi:hypothetical protein